HLPTWQCTAALSELLSSLCALSRHLSLLGPNWVTSTGMYGWLSPGGGCGRLAGRAAGVGTAAAGTAALLCSIGGGLERRGVGERARRVLERGHGARLRERGRGRASADDARVALGPHNSSPIASHSSTEGV